MFSRKLLLFTVLYCVHWVETAGKTQKLCGQHEEFLPCVYPCPPDTCHTLLVAYDCHPNQTCKPSCRCVKGYLRDKNGVCILKEKCPKLCGENEQWTDCKRRCPPQTCDTLFKTWHCPAIKEICEGGCQCLPDFLKNKDGLCIPKEQCPKPCKDVNEEYRSCGPREQETCDDRISGITGDCVSGCFCTEGHVRNADGVCIDEEECAEQIGCCDDLNATCVDCPNPCEPTCLNRNPPEICPRVCEERGCQCNKGYIRDTSRDICIKARDCPKKSRCNGDGNAEFVKCPNPCPSTCEFPRQIMCKRKCEEEGCQCKEGFILNQETNKCIRPVNCPKSPCEGDHNATLVSCPNPCAPTCSDPTRDEICEVVCKRAGCQCKKGFVRNEETNQCIKAKDCPKKITCNGDGNAEFVKCPNPCPSTCEFPRQIMCKRKCEEEGCQCKEGFILNQETNKCIRPVNCPKSPCEGDHNATLVSCPNPCAPTCSDPTRDEICEVVCKRAGCQCKKGFVRNEETNQCIKAKDCHSLLCGKNEIYTKCAQTCPPDACESLYTRYNCSQPQPPADCKPACWCKGGYLRNKAGVCITVKECLLPQARCSINETYSNETEHCPPNTCDYRDRAVICVPEKETEPSPGCDCKENYYRNGLNDCVLEKDCPTECNGDPKSVPVRCPNPCPATCANGGVLPDTCTKECLEIGCRCKLGYVLDEKSGKCVDLMDCPKGGCFPTCENGGVKPENCTSDRWILTSAECLDGYVLDTSIDKCVRPEDCPLQSFSIIYNE